MKTKTCRQTLGVTVESGNEGTWMHTPGKSALKQLQLWLYFERIDSITSR